MLFHQYETRSIWVGGGRQYPIVIIEFIIGLNSLVRIIILSHIWYKIRCVKYTVGDKSRAFYVNMGLDKK